MVTLGTPRFVQVGCAGLVSASSTSWLWAVGETPMAPSLPARRPQLRPPVLLVGPFVAPWLAFTLAFLCNQQDPLMRAAARKAGHPGCMEPGLGTQSPSWSLCRALALGFIFSDTHLTLVPFCSHACLCPYTQNQLSWLFRSGF